MNSVTENGWGFKLNIKWVLVEAAPLTASGLNEIILGGPTRLAVRDMAKAGGYVSRNRYKIVKLADIYQKEAE